LIIVKGTSSLGGTAMAQILVNKSTLENSVKRIVKQSFPFAIPSELAMEATDKGLRGGDTQYTIKVSGSKRERFVWGSSRLGSSRLVG
jgi:hypothetical protein